MSSQDSPEKEVEPNLTHIAGKYQDGVQYCVRCRGILHDNRNAQVPEGQGVFEGWEEGREVAITRSRPGDPPPDQKNLFQCALSRVCPMPDPIETAKKEIGAAFDECLEEINEAFDKFLDQLKGEKNEPKV